MIVDDSPSMLARKTTDQKTINDILSDEESSKVMQSCAMDHINNHRIHFNIEMTHMQRIKAAWAFHQTGMGYFSKTTAFAYVPNPKRSKKIRFVLYCQHDDSIDNTLINRVARAGFELRSVDFKNNQVDFIEKKAIDK
jgi:hypothetical protein